MRPERGLSTISHCLEWYKLALRTRLPTPAVHYLVLNITSDQHYGQSQKLTTIYSMLTTSLQQINKLNKLQGSFEGSFSRPRPDQVSPQVSHKTSSTDPSAGTPLVMVQQTVWQPRTSWVPARSRQHPSSTGTEESRRSKSVVIQQHHSWHLDVHAR